MIFSSPPTLATYVFIVSDWLHVSIHGTDQFFFTSFKSFGLGVSFRVKVK